MTMNNFSAAIAMNARLTRSRIGSLLVNRYTAFIFCVFVYALIVKLLGGMGGVVTLTSSGELAVKKEYFELTLLFYLYCYFNMILRPSRWQGVLAAVPILFAYLGQDIYYLMYSGVFRGSELTEVPELLTVASYKLLLVLFITVVVPSGIFFWSVNYRKWKALIAGSLPLVLLIGAAEFFPLQYTTFFNKVGREIVFWSDAVSVENNGRFMMLLYREAERKIAVGKTEVFRDRPRYEQQARQQAGWISANGSKRNVHLVVMESFVDPLLFRGASYTASPVHPSFKKLFGTTMGFSVSPVFGGKTSQAEFELLCGVPAFEELAGVEFNNFSGAPAYCLPGTLQLAGYRTMATNAYKPNFFNTPKAYEGMGFGAMYFPREFSGDESYLRLGDTSGEMNYLFDGEMFNQNLAFITPLIKEKSAQPLFNYMLTIYGHTPHIINEKKRPRILKLKSSFKDPQLERAANQFFYRSEAVASYVNRLLEVDAKSLIILVSDHLPPSQYGRTSYRKLRYLNNREDNLHMNRILIIENGTVKKYVTVHHYDVPAIVLNYVTNGAYCREHSCGFAENTFVDDRLERHDEYMHLMAHATE
jgi:phosphoglycerol transferase MdoB-like AlkP superfamily enzyme